MNWAEQHIQKIETPKTKTKEQQEIQMWCNEYMPKLSIRACMDEAGL